MQRAQRRNAAVDTKFIFRKHILPPGHHSPTASGTVTPCNTCGPESVIKGDPKMDNCFEPITEPVSAKRVKIEDEYEDMTMNEIMNGKVSVIPVSHSRALITVTERRFPRFTRSGLCLSRNAGCDAEKARKNPTVPEPVETTCQWSVQGFPFYLDRLTLANIRLSANSSNLDSQFRALSCWV